MVLLKGYAAARFVAEMTVPRTRPGGMEVNLNKVLKWKDASEEQRNDPRIMWVTGPMKDRKITFIKLTDEEVKEKELNEEWRRKEIYKFLRDKYEGAGYEKIFEKEQNGDPSPACFISNGQCNLFCPYWKGECRL